MNAHRLARLALCSTVLLSQLGHAAVDTVDRIVAVVNRGAITAHELDNRVESVKHNLESQKVAMPPEDALRQQVLDRMITEKVQEQYAASIGIGIDNNQLDRAVAGIAEQNKMSVADFRKALQQQGVVWNTFRDEVRTEILLTRLKQREIDAKVLVTDSEIDDALKLAEGKQQVEYQLAHILVSLPENASSDVIAQKRARIIAARQELEAGKDFAAVAAVYSNAQDATSGGTLGWRAGGSLPPAVTGMLDKLKPGELTDVIRSPAGFHLMKLLDKRSKDAHEVVQQTHARHILIKVNELVSDEEAKQKISQLRDRILRGGKFEDVAKAFSEDGSASKGGDLGWINPGETVPEFEQAMASLKPGELSQPVRSSFGYHLITVLEQRQQDVTIERNRGRVAGEIKQRKTEEQYEDWVRQLRDKAFVSIRLKDQ
ncbi:periplasmic chaperone for outer membrane proteins SurA [Andreprevotia lacus DSM 23236]|uniref:Chaperone SurA n=1 Tax=Andreprevotia lacus DSM 23236 TaxID=1121001 RepID=A0A1W1Y1C3_9NEIS|nr:peptidylprolyl isomerase [Andreprevotia lacus]SMC29568.1 periplasmic chaperone for outer membrane proteins SurA [Andreprevotia lacus DSM 23236]